MYYLRIYNQDTSEFGFVVEGIHEILPSDIPITDEDYNLFFEEYNGKKIKIKKIDYTSRENIGLFDVIEIEEEEQ